MTPPVPMIPIARPRFTATRNNVDDDRVSCIRCPTTRCS